MSLYPKWTLCRPHPVVPQLASKLRLEPVTVQVLINRGLHTIQEIENFYNPKLDQLHDPFLLSDLPKAVGLIKKAIAKQVLITVYGDYDVDGITAAALLQTALTDLGARVNCYIPDRFEEGYGLNAGALKQIAAEGTKLLITVDCGITSIEEVILAKNLQMGVIITDHHTPAELLPAAHAILNPLCPGCRYPFKELAGVGVVFKLVQALYRYLDGREHKAYRYLDLVGLGTVCDMVTLTGENRLLVKFALKMMNEGKTCIGLRALIKEARLNTVAAEHLGFRLGPMLNAAGRLEHADQALALLTTGEVDQATRLACYLKELNLKRQKLTKQAVEEAAVAANIEPNRNAFVIHLPEVPEGIVGLVAGKLKEAFKRPSIVFSGVGDLLKGSGRSVDLFNMVEGLSKVKHLLENFGGHPLACGLTIKKDNLLLFSQQMQEMLDNDLWENDPIPRLRLDAVVDPQDISFRLANELGYLEPYGAGNPKPLLALRNFQVITQHTLRGNHLKFTGKCDGIFLQGIGFRLGEVYEKIDRPQKLDLAFFPQLNTFNGKKTLELYLEDLRAASHA